MVPLDINTECAFSHHVQSVARFSRNSTCGDLFQFCNFDYSNWPYDRQNCSFTFGTLVIDAAEDYNLKFFHVRF